MKQFKNDKQRITVALSLIAAGLLSLFLDKWIGYRFPGHRYVQQLFGLLTLVSFGLLLFLTPRLFPVAWQEAIGRGARFVFGKVGDALNKVRKKIREKLGLPDPALWASGQDERSIFFGLKEKKEDRKSRHMGPKLRLKDQDDNAGKVRFYFQQFVLRNKKHGYRYWSTLTPDENGAKWHLTSEEGGDMFRLYRDARFSEGRKFISDDDVDYAKEAATK